MSRQRDSQRSKLYAAERTCFGQDWPLMTLAEAEAYAHWVTGTRWWRRRFPRAPRTVRVKDGRGRRNAGGARYHITLPRWARSQWVILHELAHTATMNNHTGAAAHGPEYARAYLDLVARFLGGDWAWHLRAAFRAHRVRHHLPRPDMVVAARERLR